MSWIETARKTIKEIEKSREVSLSLDESQNLIYETPSERSELCEIRSIHLKEATQLFKKRGWVQIYSTYLKTSLYLVRNKWIKVPDRTIPRYCPEEVASLRGLSTDEVRTLHEAKGIFGGTIRDGKRSQ